MAVLYAVIRKSLKQRKMTKSDERQFLHDI